MATDPRSPLAPQPPSTLFTRSLLFCRWSQLMRHSRDHQHAADGALHPSNANNAPSNPIDIIRHRRRPIDDTISRAITPMDSESPLHRAGLLQLHNTHTPISGSVPRQFPVLAPHSQDTIRASTMRLSNMLVSPPVITTMRQPTPLHSSAAAEFLPFPTGDGLDTTRTTASPEREAFWSTTSGGSSTLRRSPPSGLSALLSREQEEATTPAQPMGIFEVLPEMDHVPRRVSLDSDTSGSLIDLCTDDRYFKYVLPTDETTPLLERHRPISPHLDTEHSVHSKLPQDFAKRTLGRVCDAVLRKDHITTAIKSIPAVILGCLLNVLDGVSYGMILFPAAGVFADWDMGSIGVSMFFVSTLIAQLVYTLGGSNLAGANGSMMIEVVPFFHLIATKIAQEIGEDKPHDVIATTMVAFALSSILTGLSFFLLGALKLGSVIGFFPRHILVGCIGGIGAFLIETGLMVSTRLDDDEFSYLMQYLESLFLDKHNFVLWTISLSLAVILRIITHKFHHQLIFPLYFLVIPLVFYIVVVAMGLDLSVLRSEGWLFDMGIEQKPWYTFYTYFDFKAVQVGPLLSTLPTQFALLFFNILHPPLNVPALSVSLNEDVNTDQELVAHGYSNLLSGFFGTVPNYLVYVNTLLFYRVGGTSRIAGFLLVLVTVVLLVVGTGFIAFIPVMVVGALIFVLGIDLVKEALWDTRHRVSTAEYITIMSIVVCMTVWDFVIGILFGIIMTCFFFVVQNSRRCSIRAFHTGETGMSSVRRPGSQRAYLREVTTQTSIFRLQGFLFFGTIVEVEEKIRSLIDGPSWHSRPVRFLVLDLTHVAGVDMSAAEAFVRVQRVLVAKGVVLVFCGFSADSAMARALQSVDVLGSEGVELFSAFNDAMEWTENAYLKAWCKLQKLETVPVGLPGRRDVNIFPSSVAGSPRRSHLRDAGSRTIADEFIPNIGGYLEHSSEPFNTLVRAFSPHGDLKYDAFEPLLARLERKAVPEGHVLWKQGDQPDGLYFIESGVLRASYRFADHAPPTEESMVPGSLSGEITALSGLPRNSTVCVERDCVLWRLAPEALRALELEYPALAITFVRLVLKTAKIDFDILLSSMAARQ